MKKRFFLAGAFFISISFIIFFNINCKADSAPYLINTKVITNDINSYVGIQNDKYTADKATRFYILPKDHVTTGVGGALKIFGDAYQLGQDYRDLGIYFHADQNGDRGSNGSGVFWINEKVYDGVGGQYINKNPDIGFSFQDGKFVAGRFSLINNNTVFVFGKNASKLAKLNPNIRAEVQGNLALRNNDYIQWSSADGSKLFGISGDSNNKFKISTIEGLTCYADGVLKMQVDKNKTEVKNALVTSSLLNSQSVKTIDATNTNRIKLTSDGIVSKINGNDGQTITILFKSDKATIQNNDTIKLANAKDFTGGINSTLVLENIEGVWYEISRSINHS